MATRRQRSETFEVQDGYLIREVVPRRGKPYTHRCSLATFEHVAHAIDEAGHGCFTLETIVADEDLPFTQVAVALALVLDLCGFQLVEVAQLDLVNALSDGCKELRVRDL